MINMGKEKARDYQWRAFNEIANHIRTSGDPAIATMATGAGKSCVIAMIAKRCDDVGMKMLMLARQGELVEQDSEWMWRIKAKNSIYSASLNKKSTTYGIICGTEGTVVGALDSDLKNYVPDIIVCDEAHQLPFEDFEKDEPETQYGKIITEFYKRNPKLRVIGLTGSPFRGVDPIIGRFWKKELIKVGEQYLTDNGYLKPTVFGFGHDDVQYDLAKFKHSAADGIRDYTSKELQEMERHILDSETTTQKIMREVESVMSDRGGVALITCAGKKHCIEAAKNLDPSEYGIITADTKSKDREDILAKAKREEIQYLFQIGCLTTGIDIPAINTIVILRNIGSLTLLVQLIGRGLRPHITNENQRSEFFTSEEDEVQKRLNIMSVSASPNCLILDYSGTMHEMGELYHNPILEKAELQRSRGTGELIQCPKCYTENSKYARRCVGTSTTSPDGRCEWFWQSKECPSCGCENDTTARDCRNCGEQLRDPNEKLTGKHYTDDDYVKVNKMHMTMTKNQQGIVVTYDLENGERATEFFYPFSQDLQAKNAWRNRFVFKHAMDKSKALKMRSVTEIIKMKAIFNAPIYITHRVNSKGKSIVHRKKFRSGRVEEG